MTSLGDTATEGADLSGQLHESWLFMALLEKLSTSESNLGFIYAVLDLLAQRYQLDDAVVVLGDPALGLQAFRLGQKQLPREAPASVATAPGVFTEPDIVPAMVREAVRNVCQVSLTLHMARYGADHDPLTRLANRRHFDDSLATAAVQCSRYGWAFTLLLLSLHDTGEPEGTVSDDVLRTFGSALRRAVRHGDVAAHLGDAEFAVILSNAEGTEVLAFTERLRGTLMSYPNLNFTVGTAMSPGDSTDPTELYRGAAGRLYERKCLTLP